MLIPRREAPAPERNNFDAIRLAMALLVVWSHSFALHIGSEDTEWISIALHGRYNAGNLGVMAFFVISGFLITQSWERSKTARSYFEKRVRRIYPGYIVATSICAFVVAPMFGSAFPNWISTLGLNLLLRNAVPNAFPGNPNHAVNGSLWSIPFEFWCYIGVAVGGTLLLKRPRSLIGLCALLMVGKIVMDVTGKMPGGGVLGLVFGWPYIWSKIGPSFLLGIIAYAFEGRVRGSWVVLLGLWAGAAAACWLSQHLGDLLVAPALAYTVFMVGFSDRLRVHDAAKYGDLSYGTYLYAFPIQQILQATTHLSLPAFMFTSMGLSLLAGILSWNLVEKRFMPRRRRKAFEPARAAAVGERGLGLSRRTGIHEKG